MVWYHDTHLATMVWYRDTHLATMVWYRDTHLATMVRTYDTHWLSGGGGESASGWLGEDISDKLTKIWSLHLILKQFLAGQFCQQCAYTFMQKLHNLTEKSRATKSKDRQF